MRRTTQTLSLEPHHSVTLLSGAAEYFAALCAAIAQARHSVWLETYLLDLNGATPRVLQALSDAAARGTAVVVTVDGVGTDADTLVRLQRELHPAVILRVYQPLGSWGAWGLLLPRRWRRLHRKLCVVDGRVAFCGGINLLDDYHDPNHGPLTTPRLDFAVHIEGSVVANIAQAMHGLMPRTGKPLAAKQLPHKHPHAHHSRKGRGAATRLQDSAQTSLQSAVQSVTQNATQGGAFVGFALHHYFLRRRQIERAYLAALHTAHSRVVVANAYFLPSLAVRRALLAAAARGVRVELLLQGRYEYFMQYRAARGFYAELLRAGVHIYEYQASFLHAKVAVVDGSWATVGSSNLDPLSLLLAHEANLVVQDGAFAAELQRQLDHAMSRSQAMSLAQFNQRSRFARSLDFVAYSLMRAVLLLGGYRY